MLTCILGGGGVFVNEYMAVLFDITGALDLNFTVTSTAHGQRQFESLSAAWHARHQLSDVTG